MPTETASLETSSVGPSAFNPEEWFRPGKGPRYQQLHRYISAAIQSGKLRADDQLPSERELASLADISRVTVRKAVSQLVNEGLIEQRQGAGSFVRRASPKLQQSLASLISFTENMATRGMQSSSEVLSQGLFSPSQQEMISLGVSLSTLVARVQRLRSAGHTLMAVETSSLPEDILPAPEKVSTSLYAVLRERDVAPTRAIQRVTAENLGPRDAELLKLPEGTAVLKIERTGYLANGRPVEFTRGIYRSDIYDFVSEIRRD